MVDDSSSSLMSQQLILQFGYLHEPSSQEKKPLSNRILKSNWNPWRKGLSHWWDLGQKPFKQFPYISELSRIE